MQKSGNREIAFQGSMAALPCGVCGIITKLSDTDAAFAARLTVLGFTPGTNVVCVAQSPLGDPRAYRVKDAVIALRKSAADFVTVRQSPGDRAD